jgi:hypothetical protein
MGTKVTGKALKEAKNVFCFLVENCISLQFHYAAEGLSDD